MQSLLTVLTLYSPQEIIDLTQEDTNSEPLPWNYIPIIDLTKEDSCSPPPAADCTVQDQVSMVHASHPQLCFSTKQEVETSTELIPAAPSHGYPTQPSIATDTVGKVENKSGFSPASSHHSPSYSLEPSRSTTTNNTDSNSLASTQLDRVLFSPSPSILDSNGSTCGIEETPLTFQLRELPPRLSPVPASITKRSGKAKRTSLEAGGSQEAIRQVTSASTKADSMVWLNKLRYFRRSGVQHLFFHGATSDRETPQVNGFRAATAQPGPLRAVLVAEDGARAAACSTSPFRGSFAKPLGSLVIAVLLMVGLKSQLDPRVPWGPSFHPLPYLAHSGNPSSSPAVR